MTDLFVTGASGLVGANLCRVARAREMTVRALVRDRTSGAALSSMGCEVVVGDLSDRALLHEAIDGTNAVIHAAAVIGGTWSTATADDFEAVNYQGVANVLSAVEAAGNPRCVLINTAAILDWSHTLTEVSPTVAVTAGGRTYTAAKLAAYYLAMHQAARGQDVSVVIPGGIYGPSPLVERALVPTSFNSTLLAGLRGELDEYLAMPLMWVFVDDVVEVSLAAARSGRSGARYLALGAPEDVCSLPAFCNRLNELAGVVHRVRNQGPMEHTEKYGTMARFALQTYANPPIDPSATTRELGVAPTPMTDALEQTLAWFRHEGHV